MWNGHPGVGWPGSSGQEGAQPPQTDGVLLHQGPSSGLGGVGKGLEQMGLLPQGVSKIPEERKGSSLSRGSGGPGEASTEAVAWRWPVWGQPPRAGSPAKLRGAFRKPKSSRVNPHSGEVSPEHSERLTTQVDGASGHAGVWLRGEATVSRDGHLGSCGGSGEHSPLVNSGDALIPVGLREDRTR